MHLSSAVFPFLALVANVLSQQPAPAPSGAAPKTLALLVGIANYPVDSGFAALGGPHHDVQRVREVLENRLRFAPESIVTLLDEKATHEGIVRAIRSHLIDQAGPDTRVVLWFSGHGSRVPDASGKDSSPYEFSDSVSDETFVAWDSRSQQQNGSYDVSDDELFTLLSLVRSNHVVMVADCCHSSGLLRGGPRPGVREAPMGKVPVDPSLTKAFWPAGLSWRDDDDWRDVLPNLVFVAACGSDEEAGEIEMEGRTFGTLTWYLTQALLTAEKNASWSRLVLDVRALVAGVGSRDQLVDVSGPAERAVFDGSAVDVPRRYYEVDRRGSGPKQLVVGAGRLHGIGDGAELELFDLGGNRVGAAKVDKVRATSCNATWLGADEPPRVAMRAFPKSLGASALHLRIALGDGVDPALLAESPVARLAPSRSEADYELKKSSAGYELRDRDGTCVRTMGATPDDVRLGLLKEQQFRSLWEGVAVPGSRRIRITVEPATPAEVARMRIQQPPAALHEPRAGEGFAAATVVTPRFAGLDAGGGYVKLVVTNLSEEPLHVALVSASQDREVNVLYGRTADNVIGPGGTFPKLVWVGVGERWPANVPMEDRYIVVATPRYADFRPFTSDAPAVTRGGDTTELPPFLREALGATRTRGDLDVPNWGIAMCKLTLVTPDHFESSRRPGGAKSGPK